MQAGVSSCGWKADSQGFKSFAERLEFIFEPGITAIVGPAVAKGNVVDAIRWALGEQSLHSLQGERLEDIIFNGSGFGALTVWLSWLNI